MAENYLVSLSSVFIVINPQRYISNIELVSEVKRKFDFQSTINSIV